MQIFEEKLARRGSSSALITDGPLKHCPGTALALLVICTGAYIFFSNRPLIPDVAWLIEGTRRWLIGGRLYVDVLENNPPLVFYETAVLTGGVLTTKAYVAGVCLIMAASALWSLRLRGAVAAVSALIAMLAGGLTDFGQRDHLALVFVIPFLLGGKRGAYERVATGLWAFLGVGLKPYLLLIPAAVVLARIILERSIRPVFASENLALGGACVAYLFFIFLVHPDYVNGIVPLARFVYWTYGNRLDPLFAALSAIVFATSTVPILSRDREWIPTAAAALGALASFWIQGRYWSYHLVPAAGLGIFLAIVMGRTFKTSYILAGLLLVIQLLRGPHPGQTCAV